MIDYHNLLMVEGGVFKMTHTHKQTKIGMNAELRLIILNDCCTGGPKGHSKLTLFEVLNELCVLKPCLITLQHYLNIIVFLW